MEEQIIILKKENIKPEQFCAVMDLLRKEICPTNVEKSKHKLAEALCELRFIDELNEVSSYFNNQLAPFIRNNIEQMQELLKQYAEN